MGLLYILPCTESETERIEISKGEAPSITLKSYGLPKIFWLYFLGILFIILLMTIAVKDPMVKLYLAGDLLNQALVLAVLSTLILIPAALLFFFLYEKRISKFKNSLTIGHFVLGLKLKSKKLVLTDENPFLVTHFTGTPNIAKGKKDPKMRAFENQGYFELFGNLENGKKFFIDRNNRKADLVKIASLLDSF